MGLPAILGLISSAAGAAANSERGGGGGLSANASQNMLTALNGMRRDDKALFTPQDLYSGGAGQTPAPQGQPAGGSMLAGNKQLSTWDELAADVPKTESPSQFGRFVKGGGIGNIIGLALKAGAAQRSPRNQPPPWPMPMPQTPMLNPFAQQPRQQPRRELQSRYNLGMGRFALGRR